MTQEQNEIMPDSTDLKATGLAERLDQEQVDQLKKDVAISFGAARFKYFQQRAQRQAQYAAQGYRMPPTDYTNLSYLTYCVSQGLAMMGHG